MVKEELLFSIVLLRGENVTVLTYVFVLLAYFSKVGLCDLHAVCVSVNPPY
jgi:hypothetical protein